MSEEPNDSPAFRLRPRAEPKSYYSIRLEYSANPAAFTRERPRSSGTKRRGGSSKASYSKSKQHCKSKAAARHAARNPEYDDIIVTPLASPVKTINIVTKEDIEREERHKLLKRETARSMTANTMISPFIQRIAVADLKPACTYGYNYITVKIEKVMWMVGGGSGDGLKNGADKLAVCRCFEVQVEANDDEDFLTEDDNDRLAMTTARLNVQVHKEYADEKLLKSGKIMNIGKFRTGQATPSRDLHGDTSAADQWINFDVIVSPPPAPGAGLISFNAAATGGNCRGGGTTSPPLIPFVSITDMIEQPTEPYVEMAPPSPVPQPKTEPPSDLNQSAAPVDTSATYSISDTSLISSASSASTNKSTIIDSSDEMNHINHHHHHPNQASRGSGV